MKSIFYHEGHEEHEERKKKRIEEVEVTPFKIVFDAGKDCR